MSIEVNGPANIVMMIDVWGEKNEIVTMETMSLIKDIRAEADKTVKYMTAHDKNDSIKWHEVE